MCWCAVHGMVFRSLCPDCLPVINVCFLAQKERKEKQYVLQLDKPAQGPAGYVRAY